MKKVLDDHHLGEMFYGREEQILSGAVSLMRRDISFDGSHAKTDTGGGDR